MKRSMQWALGSVCVVLCAGGAAVAPAADEFEQVVVGPDGSVRAVQIDASGREQRATVDAAGNIVAEDTAAPGAQQDLIDIGAGDITIDANGVYIQRRGTPPGASPSAIRAGALEVIPAAPGRPVTVQSGTATVQTGPDVTVQSGNALVQTGSGVTVHTGPASVQVQPGSAVMVGTPSAGTAVRAGALQVNTAPQGQSVDIQGHRGSLRVNPDGSVVIQENQ